MTEVHHQIHAGRDEVAARISPSLGPMPWALSPRPYFLSPSTVSVSRTSLPRTDALSVCSTALGVRRHVTFTRPFASVTALAGDTLPVFVAKRIVASGTGLPYTSFTVATTTRSS